MEIPRSAPDQIADQIQMIAKQRSDTAAAYLKEAGRPLQYVRRYLRFEWRANGNRRETRTITDDLRF